MLGKKIFIVKESSRELGVGYRVRTGVFLRVEWMLFNIFSVGEVGIG